MNTYRARCHVDGCETRFLGTSREKYLEHLREAHGHLVARIWDEMMVEDNSAIHEKTPTETSPNAGDTDA